jgi:phenylalanyl-tRNA synthetase beta chain
MKVPYELLREYVQTSLSTEAIGELLTMAGFEVEGIETAEGEPVLDVKVMANRGDGLSILGLAREVLAKDPAARPGEPFQRAMARLGAGTEDDGGGLVAIETPDCARYACRVFERVQNGASPEWLQRRLRQAGQRPISLLVDLANYVMLELGQPLHAFDMDRLEGGRIVVRQARPGERLTTLDGRTHDLSPDQMMICDAVRPVAAAGIMGGADTEVGPATRRMLLESAHFDAQSVRRTRKQLGLGTEASYRFERSVDPEGVVAALDRFRELYASITGGEAGQRLADLYPAPPQVRALTVRPARARAILGMEVEARQCREHLTRLGFAVSGTDEALRVVRPSWRPDVAGEIDLVEEIGRVHGFEHIPEAMPHGTTPQGGLSGISALEKTVRETMLRAGYTQIVSHTLCERHPLDFSHEWLMGPRNPHSPEAAHMRSSLLPGLAAAAQRNGARDLHLFEVGRVFLRGEYQIDESPELAILSTGALYPPHWRDGGGAQADFYSVKGAVECLMRALGVAAHFDHPRKPDRRFHPTRQAGLLVDEGKLWVGTVGQIHPDAAEEIGLPKLTVMAELDLLVIAGEPRQEVRMRPFGRNPAVRRDLSFLIDKAVPYAEVEAALSEACGALLERQWLFDVYEGKGTPEGRHSLAVALRLRRMGANLTDEEANEVRDRARAAVEALGAQVRA